MIKYHLLIIKYHLLHSVIITEKDDITIKEKVESERVTYGHDQNGHDTLTE